MENGERFFSLRQMLEELEKEFPGHFDYLNDFSLSISDLKAKLNLLLPWGVECNLSLEDVALYANHGYTEFISQVNFHLRIRKLFAEIRSASEEQLKIGATYRFRKPYWFKNNFFIRMRVIKKLDDLPFYYWIEGITKNTYEPIDFGFLCSVTALNNLVEIKRQKVIKKEGVQHLSLVANQNDWRS